jgi:Tol biopolymer transport system component/DNA-binding winged helix-turn-helix (wHTH) protein
VNDQSLPKTPDRRRQPFRLGDLEVRPDSGEVHGPRGTVRLRPLLVEILLRLAAEPGAVVRRETLLDEVWPRRMVNDEVLSRAIAELRTALGDDARAARYVETLPKIGYRLVARFEAIEGASRSTGERGQSTGDGKRDPALLPSVVRPLSHVSWLLPAIAIAGVIAAAFFALRDAADRDRLGPLLAAARVFTSDPGLELGPRFSPDGRHVAFAMGAGSTSRIVVQRIDDSSRRLLGTGQELLLSPVFFPDGERLALWRRAGGECAIVEHDLRTGRERRLLDCALSPRARFDLSPDGKRLVFAGQKHPQTAAGLWLADVDGEREPQPLTSLEAGMGEDGMPRFSPDGRRVAFFRGNESHRQPWVVELAGRSARRLGQIEGLSYGMAWLGPKGPLVAAADWLGFRALNVIDAETGEARLLGARGARFPDVGPGGAIAWEHAQYTANLWLVAPGAEPRELWPATRHTSQPEVSPDGRSVAFASNRDGTDALYVAALDGSPRRIAFGDAYRYMRPHWSADGRAVHAVRVTLGPTGRSIQEGVRIPADGAGAEVLPLQGIVGDVRESPDGRWLVWSLQSANALQLWRAPRDRPAESERLALPPVAHYHLNAEWLVFAQPQIKRLTACRLDTLACTPMPVELGDGELYNWTLGSRSLFLRTRTGGRAVIARYDLATGRQAGTLEPGPAGTGTTLAVDPEERLLVVAREEGPTVDLMLAR